MFFQEGLNNASLNASTPAVDQSDFVNSSLQTLFNVFFHDARNVLGSEGMQIKGIFYRNDNRPSKGCVCIQGRFYQLIFPFPAHKIKREGRKIFRPLPFLDFNSS